MKAAAFVVFAGFCLVAGLAEAGEAHFEGAERLLLDIGPVGSELQDGTLECMILCQAKPRSYSSGAQGRVTLALPPGLVLASGDASWNVALGRRTPDANRITRIRLRPSQDGDYLVQLSAEVIDKGGRERDIKVITLHLSLRGNEVQFQQSIQRNERELDGRRFRFGQEYPVFLEQPDPLGPIEVSTAPVAVESIAAECAACGAGDEKVVPLIVTVNPGGRVSWIRKAHLSPRAIAEETVEAARVAVRKWKFEPAVDTTGRRIAGWARVNVVVSPSAR